MNNPPTHSVGINPYSSKGELSVLFAGHAQTAPDHRVGPQVLDYYLLHVVMKGRGSFRCLGQEYALGAGDGFFIFPGELVEYRSDPDDPWDYRWVGFRGELADALLTRIGVSAFRPVVQALGKRRIPALLQRMERSLGRGLPSCDLQSGGYLRLLLAELIGEELTADSQRDAPAPGGKQQVNQAIRWLTLQYSQPISIEQMAQSLGYHRTHLSKLFREHTGMPPMAFLHNIRMERAKLLLLEPLTIEQVASSVGFADPLYFSKQFKKATGETPTDYRSRAAGRERFDCQD